MNARIVVGLTLLIVAGAIFWFWPALVVSDGTETILWGNIASGVVLALLGIVLIVTGLKGRKRAVESSGTERGSQV